MLSSKDELVTLAREGVRNLVDNCVEVQAGELVVMVNDSSRIDKDLSALIEERIRIRGARAVSVWVEPTETLTPPKPVRGAAFTLSADQVAPLLKADKVVAQADPDTLARYLADSDKKPLVVTNRLGTLPDMASAPARYPWGIARTIYALMEQEMFPVGSTWHITAPGGTDLRGVVADKALRAVFVEDVQRSGNRGRLFQFPNYLPIASKDAEGILAVDWMEGRALKAAHDPPCLEIQGNKIRSIGGGLQQKQWVEEYWVATERVIQRFGDSALELDSWHGGAQPWATAWALGTRHLHFHMGRTTGQEGDFVFAGVRDLTLEVNGSAVIRNGRIAFFDHPKVRAAAERYGVEDWNEAWPKANYKSIGA